jgi:Transposase DNA-binding/Transposase DDE domain
MPALIAKEQRIETVVGEVEGVSVGDARLDRRAVAIASKLARRPGASFPDAMTDSGQLEAFYRFINNDSVSLWKLLKPHSTATANRCEMAKNFVVVHDTTECAFNGEREGLGRVNGGLGFFVHLALAVELGEMVLPLGVLGVETHFRRGSPKKRTSIELRNLPPEKRESYRWKILLEKAARLAGPCAIHVMDREADDYLLLEALQGKRFVVRSKSPQRNVGKSAESKKGLHLDEWLATLTGHAFREVKISTRGQSAFGNSNKLAINRRYPLRESRLAKLKWKAGSIFIRKPTYIAGGTPALELNVVHIFEPKPPSGQQPIEWTLFTSEPVATAEQVEAVIDAYRARWTVEEFFKALKTGCAYEKRQLGSARALINALGIFLPIAWTLLRMRSLATKAPKAPARAILTEVQLEVLPHLLERDLPAQLNAEQALQFVAQAGGHLRRNGRPGWQTLARGFEKLLVGEFAYRAGYQRALRDVGAARKK